MINTIFHPHCSNADLRFWWNANFHQDSGIDTISPSSLRHADLIQDCGSSSTIDPISLSPSWRADLGQVYGFSSTINTTSPYLRGGMQVFANIAMTPQSSTVFLHLQRSLCLWWNANFRQVGGSSLTIDAIAQSLWWHADIYIFVVEWTISSRLCH